MTGILLSLPTMRLALAAICLPTARSSATPDAVQKPPLSRATLSGLQSGRTKHTASTHEQPAPIVSHDRIADALVDFDAEQLRDLLESELDIARSDLSDGVDVYRLAAELVRVFLQEPTDDGPEQWAIMFASSVADDNGPFRPSGVFATNDIRIYACVKATELLLHKVLVKWTGPDGTFLFTSMPIDSTTEWHHVWHRRHRGWAPGKYTAELFTLAEEPERIAYGTFVIVEDGNGLVPQNGVHISSLEVRERQDSKSMPGAMAFFNYVAPNGSSLDVLHLINGTVTDVRAELVAAGSGRIETPVGEDTAPGQYVLELRLRGELLGRVRF